MRRLLLSCQIGDDVLKGKSKAIRLRASHDVPLRVRVRGETTALMHECAPVAPL